MFKAYIGSDKLPDYMNNRANEMIEAWDSHPQDWTQINLSDFSNKQAWLNYIQTLANDGYLVVSGWINNSITDGVRDSGHVTVIVPGNLEDMENSGNFGGRVPFTMDTGANMRETKQKLSLSYGKDKANNVVFYYYNR